ncbi:MAG TPA: hypothetical protein GXX75_21460 [Clostridiales bacterium]|nr:hypothetical protein [Clostridiales bacterium]
MVDLHTHILPGMDDGAGSIGEAVRMSEVFWQQSVDTVVCTPHFNPSETSLQDYVDKRADAMKKMGQSRVALVPASETYLHEYLFHYPDLSQLCIRQTDYLLIELPFTGRWEEAVYGMVERLIYYYHVIPVIAHIERYPAAKKNRRAVARFIKLGCLIQVNAHSILKWSCWPRIKRYLKKGYIHVIASDSHNLDSRPPLLAQAYDKINRKLGEQYSDRLKWNAKAVVQGKLLQETTAGLLR